MQGGQNWWFEAAKQEVWEGVLSFLGLILVAVEVNDEFGMTNVENLDTGLDGGILSRMAWPNCYLEISWSFSTANLRRLAFGNSG